MSSVAYVKGRYVKVNNPKKRKEYRDVFSRERDVIKDDRRMERSCHSFDLFGMLMLEVMKLIPAYRLRLISQPPRDGQSTRLIAVIFSIVKLGDNLRIFETW